MDIAFLLGFPEISGGTNVIMEYASRLSDLGHSVSVVTELPFDPKRLAWHPGANKVTCLSHQDVRDHVFDITLATWWRSVYDLPHVRAKRYAYFCQSIESRFFNHCDSDMKALVDLTYRLPIPIITEAQWIVEHIREVYGRDSFLVRNGIRKDLFNERVSPIDASRPNGIRVLVEGPLGVPFKRVEKTIALCKRADIKELWLLTSSDLSHYPGVSRVFSRVPMREVPPIYRSCDVLLKLSTVEGMFGPPLEMMHCGGMAITSDVTGHDEYMRNLYNGIVVSIGDEQSVIRALRCLSTDDTLLTKLKNGAQQTAKTWPDWDESASGMEDALLNIIAGTDGGLNANALDVLHAALKLAGPLHDVVHREYGLKQSLNILRNSFKRTLKRRVAKYTSVRFQSKNVQQGTTDVVQESPRSLQISLECEKILVVGSNGKHDHLFIEGSKRHNLDFVSYSVFLRNRSCDTYPKTIVVFDPDSADLLKFKEDTQNLFVVETRSVTSSLIEGYRRLNDTSRLILLHTDTLETLKLAKGTSLSPCTIILPVARPASSVMSWIDRPIDILCLGTEFRSLLQDYATLNTVIIDSVSSGEALFSMVERSKRVLYTAGYVKSLGGMKWSHMLSVMGAGCLVVGPYVGNPTPYNIMEDEHFLVYRSISELSVILSQVQYSVDFADQVRLSGTRLAVQHCDVTLSQSISRALSAPLAQVSQEMEDHPG